MQIAEILTFYGKSGSMNRGGTGRVENEKW